MRQSARGLLLDHGGVSARSNWPRLVSAIAVIGALRRRDRHRSGKSGDDESRRLPNSGRLGQGLSLACGGSRLQNLLRIGYRQGALLSGADQRERLGIRQRKGSGEMSGR
jgi:hypothetical protein